MLGLDTNVIVRWLVEDDAGQAARALRLIEQCASAGEPMFVSLLVLLETEWVLRSRYEFGKAEIARALHALLDARDLSLEHEDVVEEALIVWEDSAAGFADCLIGAHHRRQGCRATATFDAKAGKLPGFCAV